MKTGVQTYFSWHVPQQRQEEDHHGPPNGMLPQSGVPCQRPNRQGTNRHLLTQGQAVPLYRVSQDVQDHERHRVLPHLGSAGGVCRGHRLGNENALLRLGTEGMELSRIKRISL